MGKAEHSQLWFRNLKIKNEEDKGAQRSDRMEGRKGIRG